MECKFCGEKDENKLITRVIALKGKIVKRVIICIKCLGDLLSCPKNENN